MRSLSDRPATTPVGADIWLGLAPARAPGSGVWRRLRADRSAVTGLAIVGVLVTVALLAPVLAPRSPIAIDPNHLLEAPNRGHFFGTDNLGRDIFSRVVAGTRVSLTLAAVIGALMLSVGVSIGAIAGYVGRWVDTVAMRVVDVFLAFPSLVFALAIAGTLGAGFSSVLIALVSTFWPPYARVLRGGVVAEREREYVEAVRSLGARPRRILVRHILPNALSPILVMLSFDLGIIILSIASLGYLGVGIGPPTPEWGTMVADGKNFVFSAPQMVIFPGLAVALAVIGFSLLGDGLRNAYDPHALTGSDRRRQRRSQRRNQQTHPVQAGPPDFAAVGNLMAVEGLRVRIRQPAADFVAVESVSLTVGPGQTVGLVGESGCGKTLTALSIMHLLPPGAMVVGGRISLCGRDLTGASETDMRRVRGRQVGMIFQDPMTSLNPTMTIGRQIADPIRFHQGVGKRVALARAAEMLSLVGLPTPLERLADFPHQLSGGQRQRVMIAMALAGDPGLLIADEPTTALDVTIQAQILALLDDLKNRLGKGLMLITHDMGIVARMADRVLVMYAGRIVESADTLALFAGPRHPYTKALLEAVPQLEQDRSRELYSIPGRPPDLSSSLTGCPFAPRCHFASEQCRREDPPLADDGTGHLFACFHPVGHDSHAVGPAFDLGTADVVVQDRVPLLVVQNLVKEFPVRGSRRPGRAATVKAVSDVSFSVARGETFGLVGESGCGKTTIGRMIAALEKPDEGEVRFDGQDVGALSGPALRRHRRNLQVIFQDPLASLDPRMRVGSAIREPMVIHGIGSKDERDARVNEQLVEVGLEERSVDLYPHQFSGGQRQRIGFARALTLNPRLIVADEPVSSLDVSVRSQILNLMRRLQVRHGLTYILISHDLSVVRYLADRIGVMYLGKLVEVGPNEDLYRHPAHPYSAALLAAIPVPDPVRERARLTAVVKGELPSAIDPPSGCRFRTRCPRAQEICAEQEPMMRPVDRFGHDVACHFPLYPVLSTDG